jgi:hypothetical protein
MPQGMAKETDQKNKTKSKTKKKQKKPLCNEGVVVIF